MYVENSRIQTPPDDTVIWRYMRLEQLLAIVSSRSIRFTRIGAFDDPWEGSLPARVVKEWRDGLDSETVERLLELFQYGRSFCVANCWHRSNVESDALWRAYSARSCAIAIKSTVERLKRSVQGVTDHDIFVGEVEYLDYDKDAFSIENGYVAVYRKRSSFAYEHEVRAMIDMSADPAHAAAGVVTMRDGLDVPVDIDALIEEVRIAPSAATWEADAARGALAALGLGCSVEQSVLMTPPTHALDDPTTVPFSDLSGGGVGTV